MRKNTLTALILAAALLLTACGNESKPAEATTLSAVATTVTEKSATANTTAVEITTTAANTTTAEIATTTTTAPYPDKIIDFELPIMDGSTSAAPLEAGIKAWLLGINYYRAQQLVTHTTTHESFDRLISGEVDVIFTVPISAEQQAKADAMGVTLTAVPIAREGFVFIVSADNPVDALTSEQLRGIYSGEITNWSEVGGNDAPITAYQRNKDSGSQNYMTEFMGDTPLAAPKSELVQGSMGAIVSAVAINDNGVNSIGYSVYSYAALMDANAGKIKLIAVDGTAPSKATMADGSYPLLSCTYAMYTDKSPQSAQELCSLITSEEGQLCVLGNGYIPAADIEIPAKYMPYTAVGTGIKKPADYEPSRQYMEIRVNTKENRLDMLTDKEFESKINADISAAAQSLSGGVDREISYSFSCLNGYLSVTVGFIVGGFNDTALFGDIITLNYDLVNKIKIEKLSDFFYEGEDFVPLLNECCAKEINYSPYNLSDMMTSEFLCLLGECSRFTVYGIILEEGNPYYACFPLTSNIFHSDALFDKMVINQYRKLDGVFDNLCIYDGENFNISNASICEYGTNEYGYYEHDGFIFTEIKSSRYLDDAERLEMNKLYLNLQEKTAEHFKKCGINSFPYTNFGITLSGGIYIVQTCSTMEMPIAVFDKDTLEQLSLDDLITEAKWYQLANIPKAEADEYVLTALSAYNFNEGAWFWVAKCGENGDLQQGISFEVYRSALNAKYFYEQ